MATVQGTYDPAFSSVAALLEKAVADDRELGASISVWQGDKNVVNIYAGYADVAKTKHWTNKTIVNIWSSTKCVTALAILICHDRGLLNVHEPVATYWPEFAAYGKEKVLIKHLMSHTSGVSAWEKPITLDDIYDTPNATAKLAAQAPWWKPGTASGYHVINMGHLLGEIVWRVSGKTLTDFVRTEIVEPLGADFQIGAAESDWERVAELVPPPSLPLDVSTMDPNSVAIKTFTGPGLDAEAAMTPGWRKAEIGAANGHSNAASLGRILSVISNNGILDGKRFLSQATIDTIFEEQITGTDLCLGLPLRFGIGYGINTDGACTSAAPFIPQGRVAFWGGWGGSMVVMDTDNNLTVCYVMNKMGSGTMGSERTSDYVMEVYKLLRAKSKVKSAPMGTFGAGLEN
ncbi:beta-lactamase/transpeptidase-like protein [Lipomyces starkeyi]